MAQLTWRNVDAPNFSGVAAGYKAFSDLISNAGKTASDAIGTYDDTTRMDAANPGIQAYFQAAAQGDPNATKAALVQHAAAFGNLRPDQLGKVFTDGSNIARTGINNQGDYFKNAVNQRTDADQQAAIAVLNKIGPGLGSAQDVYPMFRNSKEYNALSETGKRLVQQGVLGMGYQFQGPSAIGGAGVPSLGSGSPAAAAIGGAVGTGTSRADRNANPGNLKAPEGTWVRSAPGFLGVDDGGFAKFDTPANGLAAMATQLNRYREGTQATGGKPVKTVEGIIGTWSPTSDPLNTPGSTNNYTKYVAGKLGLTPGDEVPADKMQAMAQAMYEFESGNRGDADPATALAAAARPNTSAVGNAANSQAELTLRKAQNNAGGMANVFAAMEDTKPTPASIAAQWAEQKKFPGANQGAVVDLINDMVNKYGKYGVTANVAGAILENGGLTGATDWTQRLITNRLRAMGEWVPNDKYIESQVESLKDGKTLVNAEANRGTSTADAMLTKYRQEQAAATAELNTYLAAAQDRPELNAEAIPRAQRRVNSANEMLRRLSENQQVTPNLQPVLDKPQPVATTVAGKAAPAIASAVSQTPAETYKENPGRNMWQEQQQAAAESRAKSKAEKDIKRAAEAAAKVEEEIRVEKARQEYLRRFGRVSLAPSSN